MPGECEVTKLLYETVLDMMQSKYAYAAGII